jgi:hypothetical protein
MAMRHRTSKGKAVKKAQNIAEYGTNEAIKMKGPRSVVSASKFFLLGLDINRPYLNATSIVPLNHLVRCLNSVFKSEGLSCQATTSEAYLIL